MNIHPTAIVDKKAELAEGVSVGAFSLIGPHVRIGKDTRIHSHVVIEGDTTIGERNEIFAGAVLGTPPQVRDYKNIKSSIKIGNDNVIREYVTINPGMKDGGVTRIGNKNILMISSHIGHDGIVGDGVMMANAAGLSGHVTVEDHAVIGGFVGVHQFGRIGKFSMTGGHSKVVMDIPPFSLCSGDPTRLYGLNTVGLRRANYSAKDVMEIKNALRMLFFGKTHLKEAIAQVRAEFDCNPDIAHLLDFIEKSKRGVCRVVAENEGEED